MERPGRPRKPQELAQQEEMDRHDNSIALHLHLSRVFDNGGAGPQLHFGRL